MLLLFSIPPPVLYLAFLTLLFATFVMTFTRRNTRSLSNGCDVEIVANTLPRELSAYEKYQENCRAERELESRRCLMLVFAVVLVLSFTSYLTYLAVQLNPNIPQPPSMAMAAAAPAHGVMPRSDSGVPDQNDPNFVSAVMRAHWYWRRLHCAQDLVWDTELAEAARQDIEECPKNAEHRKRAGSNLSSVGPAPDNYDAWIEFARTASHGWHEEETKYPYNDPHFEAAWGHFTQMVWRNTTRIGCAVGECDRTVNFPGRFYCYYSFFGNNVAKGQFEAQVWAPVCGDPTSSEVKERRDVNFDWTRA